MLLHMAKMQPLVKVMLVGESKFFGPGTAELLQLIKETGSVRLACSRMELSYSKAWKMIGTMEKELDRKLVERRQGGKNGGSTHLTASAKTFLQKYRDFEDACKQSAQELFAQYFDGCAAGIEVDFPVSGA